MRLSKSIRYLRSSAAGYKSSPPFHALEILSTRLALPPPISTSAREQGEIWLTLVALGDRAILAACLFTGCCDSAGLRRVPATHSAHTLAVTQALCIADVS